MEAHDGARALNPLRLLIAAFASIAMLCTLIATSCTRITTQSGAGFAGGNPWTHDGVLRVGDSRVPDNLNRMLGTLTVDQDISSLFCARLFILDDQERMLPEMATIVPTISNGGISDHGRVITYHIRPGVWWQDGAPFTARDVRFSWQQVMNPRNTVQTTDYYDQVSTIDIPDPLTAVVHLKRPDASFIGNFFTSYCVIPDHILRGLSSINHADYNRLPIGTGPFRVVENQPGVLIRFVANPHYWRGAPKIKEIDYHFIPNATTLMTQLQTHEIDFYRNVPAEQIPQADHIAHTVVYRYPFSRYIDIGFNGGRGPVSDVRVRQAIAYATDVPALIHDVTHDEDMLADSDQPPWRWSHADHLRRYTHDVTRAAALLDAAGWRVGSSGMRAKDGVPLQLDMVGLANDATALRAEQVLQQQWRTAGIGVSIHDYPEDVLYALGTGVEQSGKFDVAFEGWTMLSDPDNLQLYGCHMAPPNGWNVYHYCSPNLDAAESAARTSYDPAVRKAAYARIQQDIVDGLPFYVLWFVREEDVANSDLRGYRPGRTLSAFWNAWEWSI